MPDPQDNDRLPPGVYSSPACPPLALLRAWNQQVLPADLSSDVASHLDSCALCPALLHDLQQIAQSAITSAERSRIRRRLPLIAPPIRVAGWRWYAITAAAVALVVAGILLAVRETEHPEEARAILPTFFTHTEQAHASESSARTPAVTPPGDAARIAKLNPPANLTSSPTPHSDPSAAPEPSPQQLTPAFDAYTRGDYALATQRFSQLAKQFPRSCTPFLYLGVTQLLINDNAKALFNLTRAEQFVSPEQKDIASWYRAIAALRTRAPNAGQLLHALCGRNQSAYAEQACELEQRAAPTDAGLIR
ncbi:hypothetical protein [Edaphobacter aggregans]|uniref:hypothetical protein n=1 Tax=Edaphobacter aggregans TaxID=570835 RepID=UPI0005541B4F|nr:hypothetical protein [Edaphobacter aggregans]